MPIWEKQITQIGSENFSEMVPVIDPQISVSDTLMCIDMIIESSAYHSQTTKYTSYKILFLTLIMKGSDPLSST